jgi:hypothetical protein
MFKKPLAGMVIGGSGPNLIRELQCSPLYPVLFTGGGLKGRRE